MKMFVSTWQPSEVARNQLSIVLGDLEKLWKAGGTQLPPMVKKLQETAAREKGLKSSFF
jgi:hypothetical protein